MIFSQIPGAEQAINSAAGHSWEAVTIVVILLALLAGLAVVLRVSWSRMTKIEDNYQKEQKEQHKIVIELIKSSTKALVENNDTNRVQYQVSSEIKACLVSLNSKIDVAPCVLASQGLLSEETQCRLTSLKEDIVKRKIEKMREMGRDET